MEFLIEFFGELLAEIFIGGPLEAFFKSKKIKRWVKILFLALFWGLIEGFLLWAAWGGIRGGNTWPVTLFVLVGNALWIFVGIKAWPDVKKM